jgi:hypothetical protein
MACPASQVLPQAPTVTVHASAGRAVHAFLADPAHDLSAVPEEFRDACAELDLSKLPVGANWAAEVSLAWKMSTDTGRELGRNLQRDYPETDEDEWIGTADVIGLTADAVHVLDFKAGHGAVAEPRRNWQLALLALAACRAYGLPRARVGLVWLRDDGPRFQMADLDELDLGIVASKLRKAPAKWVQGAEPVQGPHCDYCNSFDFCPAKQAIFRAAVEIPEITDENAALVYLRADAVAKVLGRVRAALAVRAKDRPIQLPDGRVYGPVVTERESVDPLVTQAVLTRLHGPEVAQAALKLESSKAGIERAIGAVAPRGKKAALVAEALAAIAEADGIKTNSMETVREHQPKKELTQ